MNTSEQAENEEPLKKKIIIVDGEWAYLLIMPRNNKMQPTHIHTPFNAKNDNKNTFRKSEKEYRIMLIEKKSLCVSAFYSHVPHY